MEKHVNWRKSIALTLAAAMGIAAVGQSAVALDGERYEPGIWIDPDGCEHWVMDDGFEGYMSPHVTRDGLPVCHRANVCKEMGSDQLFPTDSAKVSAAGRRELMDFFKSARAQSFRIIGHTDSRASDEYNMDLSLRRARAVAAIAESAGATVSEVRGYGERDPKATNDTEAGMAANRRVEIFCVK